MTFQDWKKAGNLSHQALKYGESLMKKDASILDICKKIDDKIIELGARPAWPSQISLNNVAAHYCPEEDSDFILKDDVAKLDVGVSYNGCIGDNALTVDLSGKNQDLVKATKEALDAAIESLKPGIEIGKVGRVIQEVITSYNLSPIRNLSGHGVDKFQIHTAPTMPNYDNGDTTKLVEDQIIAIEPFATNGAGKVRDGGTATVFMLYRPKPMRDMMARKILKELESYDGLVFARRWLWDKFPKMRVNMALMQLINQKSVEAFPPLVEEANGLVSQHENTMLITKDGCEVLTK